MREFVPGVLSWSRFSEPHGYDPTEEVLDRLAKEGVAQILITNRNHTRAANRVRERTGAPVAIHPADAAYARDQGTAIDVELEVGKLVGPFTVVGVPGKSPGEIAFHDPARRMLVVGDAVIGNPPGQLSLLRERVMDDPARLRASIRALLELDFDALMLGDGFPIREGGRERLRELIASFPTD